jgi:uncharacterized Zn-binding protein involved in type VI secretion
MAGPPDTGVITVVMQANALGGGLPLATSGSICLMTNSVSGAPYPLPIGTGGSSSVTIAGQQLVRMGDMIPSGPGIMTILGPPAAPFITDTGAP